MTLLVLAKLKSILLERIHRWVELYSKFGVKPMHDLPFGPNRVRKERLQSTLEDYERAPDVLKFYERRIPYKRIRENVSHSLIAFLKIPERIPSRFGLTVDDHTGEGLQSHSFFSAESGPIWILDVTEYNSINKFSFFLRAIANCFVGKFLI